MNVFAGKLEEWLLAELAIAQDEYAAGKVIVSVGTGDMNSSKVIQVSVRQRIAELWLALNALDSTKYPMATMLARTRSKAVFA
jgi:hypothetical protein